MKLWLLKPRPQWLVTEKVPPPGFGWRIIETSPWAREWDSYHGMVVRAADEKEARAIAMEHCKSGDECRAHPVWTMPKYTSCEELTGDAEAGIVLADYLTG